MVVGPLEFDAPLWLPLAPALWAWSWWLARRSLSGLSGRIRIAALIARGVLLLLIVGALARPHWRTKATDVATVVALDVSASIPPEALAGAAAYVERASDGGSPKGRLGVVSIGAEALAVALPSEKARGLPAAELLGAASADAQRDATDLASGVRLALAIKPEGAGQRLVLISDGNETAGSLLSAAEAARAVGTPIDVLPIDYTIDREVMIDRVAAPATARRGETTNVRLTLTATAPTTGRITLLANDEPIDLDPDAPGMGAKVSLTEGVNVVRVPVALPTSGPTRFRAVFEADAPGGDTIVENNEALAVTFVSGEGRALVLSDEPSAQGALLRSLREAGIEADVRPTPASFESLVDLGAYDAVILADTEAYGFTQRQQEELRAYVHDLGGGLVAIGGPRSFGAGGWIGSPLADALPLSLDPPQKRQLPRGALALVMHSCEMPRGNYWGQRVALAAATALSRLDLVGVIEFNWSSGGVGWAYPMQEVGDGAGVKRAIANLVYGDMPDFTSILQSALRALQNAQAGQKHCVIISDGDPAGPGSALIQQFIDAGVSISTVAVFPHTMGEGGPDVSKMRSVAAATGGNFYLINSAAGTATLPQIFAREAQTVKRSLIWEGDPIEPALVNAAAEPMRGVRGLPPLTGYVVTGPRDGLAQVTATVQGQDPLVAQWQYGLGRSVAFTSDSTARWANAWVSWDQFKSFWEQHVRWAMRPSGSADVRMTTEPRGDETLIVIDATDSSGGALNFARMRGRVVSPGLEGAPLDLRMTGPGRYEGRIRTPESGAYVVNVQYDAPGATPDAPTQRGVAQAAVIKPAGEERRALASNAALLRRVAEVTGGRVLTGDATKDDLYARAGLTMPVAKRSLWALLMMLAAGALLIDVGVRRVRVEPRALAALVRRAFSKRERASERQVDAMRAAKARAKARSGEGAALASRKFDAEPVSLSGSAGAGGAPGAAQHGAATPVFGEDGAPGATATQPRRPADSDASDEEGMSRLLKAKQRAREQRRDEL